MKWTSERREAFLADYHGRDLAVHAELALDAEGHFLALRATNTSNVGAHAVSFHPLNKGMALTGTVYRVPTVSIRGRAVVTNTSPTTPYRSAGRPEIMFVTERLIDLAARRHGFDRLELRRKNLVPASAMPYRNAVGTLYDSGDYPAAFDRAVGLADWVGFEARRAADRRPDGPLTTFEILGRRLEYRWIEPSPGDAPSIVFLHEGLGCVAMWRDFPDRLAAATGCGALVYSRTGYGGSDPLRGPRPVHYMHDEALEVLPALLEHFKLEQVVLFGHSDGASIALIPSASKGSRELRRITRRRA